MAGVKGSKHVAPMIRGAFVRAAKRLESEGRPLSDLVYESLQEDFRGTLRALSGFVPKELEATINDKRSHEDFTDAELGAIAFGSSEDTVTEAGNSPKLH